jgi:hypothetical protein
MSRYSYAALALCTLGAVACDDGSPDNPSGPTHTITLNAGDDGQFEYCDDNGTCQNLPNPNECARLVIDIDTASGASCETCYDANGSVVSRSCDDTSVVCDVVTIPEPDCVVCAYVNGAIIYSTCVAEEPIECVVRESFPPCEVCYGADGNIVSDTCQQDCRAVLCAYPQCEEGYEAVTQPGECCPVCLPVGRCENVACPFWEGVPDCPPGYAAVRDPSDCCGFVCEPAECDPSLACPAVVIECPEGQELDFSPPNCCGACVPVTEYCYSDADCGSGEICSVSAGDCQSPCAPNEVCTDVCVGVCRPADVECDYPPYAYPYCEGEVRSEYDENGCPLPPVCVCDDGSVSSTGECANSCDQIACFWLPTCEEGQHLEIAYPYCCGICVADQKCYSSDDCEAGFICTTELGDCDSGCAEGMSCAAVCTGTCQQLDR